jgi:DNA-directed RNA polymerase subunit K/omega
VSVHRPADANPFTFVRVAALRAAQLMRGCTPRVSSAGEKSVVTAQREVAEGKVVALPREVVPAVA